MLDPICNATSFTTDGQELHVIKWRLNVENTALNYYALKQDSGKLTWTCKQHDVRPLAESASSVRNTPVLAVKVNDDEAE